MSQLHQAGKSFSTVSPGGTKWFASPEHGMDPAAALGWARTALR